jgi:hypothetical protein
MSVSTYEASQQSSAHQNFQRSGQNPDGGNQNKWVNQRMQKNASESNLDPSFQTGGFNCPSEPYNYMENSIGSKAQTGPHNFTKKHSTTSLNNQNGKYFYDTESEIHIGTGPQSGIQNNLAQQNYGRRINDFDFDNNPNISGIDPDDLIDPNGDPNNQHGTYGLSSGKFSSQFRSGQIGSGLGQTDELLNSTNELIFAGNNQEPMSSNRALNQQQRLQYTDPENYSENMINIANNVLNSEMLRKLHMTKGPSQNDSLNNSMLNKNQGDLNQEAQHSNMNTLQNGNYISSNNAEAMYGRGLIQSEDQYDRKSSRRAGYNTMTAADNGPNGIMANIYGVQERLEFDT